MKFEKRTTSPSDGNKYFLHTTVGGYNKCIVINSKGSCLPNCVGYAYGRFMEEQNIHSCNLSRNNAENWWGNTIDGYKRGQTPKLGAICCFSKGKVGVGSDGAGHICVVEEIKKDGTIVTSNSAAGGTRFYVKELKPPYSMTGYKFQGFIYPNTTFEEQKDTKKKYSGIFPTLPKRGYFKKGDKGEQVKKLQSFLSWANSSKLNADGIIGDKTTSEIKIFQKSVKIISDGLFGKKSLEEAKKYTK